MQQASARPIMNTAYRALDIASTTYDPSPPLVRIDRARFARAFAGAVLAVLAVSSILLAASPVLDTESDGLRAWATAAPALLLAAWPLAAAAGLVSYLAVGIFRGSADSRSVLESKLFARETLGIALPLVGVAFAAPLTLHAAMTAITSTSIELAGFEKWMAWSAALVGHAHVALAAHAFRFARQMHGMPGRQKPNALTPAITGVLLATAFALVPGVVVVLPPLIVGVTGVLFVPAAYAIARNVFVSERRAIERAHYDRQPCAAVEPGVRSL